MSRELITAAGAVVLREHKHGSRVLVVHRPRYDDWSLPKGKVKPDEYLAVTAVREIAEESGYQIRVTQPLITTGYRVNGHPKQVHWWYGQLIDPTAEPAAFHGDEVDTAEWWPAERALRDLTCVDDVLVLRSALRTTPAIPVVVVRHAKAMARKQWHGPDRDRRLTERGRRQAKALSGLLSALGVSKLASSSSTRCMDTLLPYSKRSGIDIASMAALSEESAQAEPKGVGKAMSKILDPAKTVRPVAVCGHRPVLPAMFDHLGVCPSHVLKPGEATLVYPDGTLDDGRLVHIAPRL
ncbi:hypothetical protein HMPREF1531_01384 [Propionibacterium sp. oral taxon 192 str. F0372]|uniref:NUDIX hydrolase n=1 Tax=Propionibacterium sp. oral taxon 192 TaxID=671222 RepID=UPI000353A874|nr:NUDIX hydrolase [Propionibacterium sp. oral taxon 192]EPH03325.1 hypothetical protein HMPREF1531_01384 [Propionibacterium sp. oral taxon 192 str. F0372]